MGLKDILEREYRMIFRLHYPTQKDLERSREILKLLGYKEDNVITQEQVEELLKL